MDDISLSRRCLGGQMEVRCDRRCCSSITGDWYEAGQGVKTAAAYDLQPARIASFRPEACPGDVICDQDHQVVPPNIQDHFAAQSPLACYAQARTIISPWVMCNNTKLTSCSYGKE